MFKTARKLLWIGLLFLTPIGSVPAQQNTRAEWPAKWQFLIGSWKAAGHGSPGEGAGGFSFEFDLQRRVLVRRSHTDYPASGDRPGFAHDDLMIIYDDGAKFRADYYDNEGHVIRYAVEFSNDDQTCTFTSEVTAVAQPRFRLTYTRMRGGELAIKFEIAPPNDSKNFKVYVEGTARKN